MAVRTYDDNVARLGEAHPALFEGRMPDYSDLSAGWYFAVDRLCTDIEREIEPELLKRISVLQIKQKFGRLGFHARLDAGSRLILDPASVADVPESESEPESDADVRCRERLRDLVDAASDASASICQVCGAPGSLRKLRWMKTLCDEHFGLSRRDDGACDR